MFCFVNSMISRRWCACVWVQTTEQLPSNRKLDWLVSARLGTRWSQTFSNIDCIRLACSHRTVIFPAPWGVSKAKTCRNTLSPTKLNPSSWWELIFGQSEFIYDVVCAGGSVCAHCANAFAGQTTVYEVKVEMSIAIRYKSISMHPLARTHTHRANTFNALSQEVYFVIAVPGKYPPRL